MKILHLFLILIILSVSAQAFTVSPVESTITAKSGDIIDGSFRIQNNYQPINLSVSPINDTYGFLKLKYKISYLQNFTNITFDDSNRYYINIPYRITIPSSFTKDGIITLQYKFSDGATEEYSILNLDFTKKESDKLFDRIFHTKIWSFKTKKCADEDYTKIETLEECQTYTYQSFNIETLDILIFVITVILGVIVEKMLFKKKE